MCGFCNVCVCVDGLIILWVFYCALLFTLICVCLYCVFVAFRLHMLIIICFVCTIVRTAATE